ncbi:MAG: restriction endonuclease [Acidobacteria bacterium]|jgi:restriction system protein|nr:restriction endonuclease [Acidobacteriota bacterium]
MARKRKGAEHVPPYDKLMIPVLNALMNLGGSGTIEEVNEKVYELENFSEEVLQVPHKEDGSQSEVDYRLAWARTYLKKFGLLENSARGVWNLTESEIDTKQINTDEIVRHGKSNNKKSNKKSQDETSTTEIEKEVEESLEWKEQLLDTILEISPNAFERLAQRLLRESGFVEVEVTGRSGDGGIDGKGIARMSGLLSFHVIFQCKRYKGSITPSQIRDFRGAMQGRADKGIFITTGNFTRDARKEATRDGAPPIDLIDGELLCEKLKEFSLGVKTKIVEEVEIDEDFFTKF